VAERRSEVTEILRQRVLRALQAGTLHAGDRLPSTRDLSAEFGEDHRVILASYRALADEGLVELRPRGGVYAARTIGPDGALPLPAEGWLIDTLAEAVARGIPAVELGEWLRRVVSTLRLRAAVVATTPDQIEGIRRELLDEYGLESEGVDAAHLETTREPVILRHIDILVTTEAHTQVVQRVAKRLGKPSICATVRPDLIGGEWSLLLKAPVYVVVRDDRFADTLARFFANTEGRENLRMMIVGRDDLTTIPAGAPTYVTRSARDAIGDVRIAGRILPAARIFSAEASREILSFIVRANLRAMTPHRPAVGNGR
jgi:DNA-binding transcriptional regulator YhcF (GntR family)